MPLESPKSSRLGYYSTKLTTFILYNVHPASQPPVERPDTLLRLNHVDNFPSNTRSSISTPLDCQFLYYWYDPVGCYHYQHRVLLVAQRPRDQSFFLVMVCSSSAPHLHDLKDNSKQLLYHKFTLFIETTLLFPTHYSSKPSKWPCTSVLNQTAASSLLDMAVYRSQASLLGNSLRHLIMTLTLVLPLPTHPKTKYA